MPFKLTYERSASDTVVIRKIVRQTPALKATLEAVIAGNIKQSFTMIASIPTTTLSRNRNSDSPTNSVIDLK